MKGERADVAVIGGTGFSSWLAGHESRTVQPMTPYGEPSAPITVGDVAGRSVAFLPRHGADHSYPPHRINYRANLWALRWLGVRQVIAPCAVGGLQPDRVQPGDLVVPDQLVDCTTGRAQSFVEHGATHVPFADPYCPRLTVTLGCASDDIRIGGTMVVIDGPRFSTRAESQWFSERGWTLINMTGHPEAVLARELLMCYLPVAVVTDLDAGVASGEGVGETEVYARFAANLERLTSILATAIGSLPDPAGCSCSSWADGLDLAYDIPA